MRADDPTADSRSSESGIFVATIPLKNPHFYQIRRQNTLFVHEIGSVCHKRNQMHHGLS